MTEAEAAPPKGAKYTRELTTAVVAPLTIWIIGWAHPLVFDATFAMVCALALYEFLLLGRRKGYKLPTTVCIGVLLFILGTFSFSGVPIEVGVVLALLLIPASYVLGRGSLEEALPSTAVAVFATLYIGLTGGSLIRLHSEVPNGWKLTFFLLIVVWFGDSGAYYAGSRFGRRQLSPRISPRKTVEGAIGGVFMSIVGALAIHFTFFREFPLIHSVIAGVILSITGVIGDLAESMWKRSAAVKDSGSLIPGHGGFLDRFDSIFFTAPILSGYWFLVQHGFKGW
ncbi:MAG TPA: phosphatidate cytidylyltransferase [Thermoanaerobaculia bacterium]|nr:phosphatidate cytidylyltransferase [Thermoanaerobaculia bacterium]